MKLRLPDVEYSALCKTILRRDGYKCQSCKSRSNLHVHHIIFRSQQGPDEEWNLIVLCNSCHDGVHKDVKNGVYGLVIAVHFSYDAPVVTMVRRPGWKPQ